MTPGKRLFDLALGVLLAALLALPMLAIASWLLAVQGRPILYPAERMRAPGRPFTLWKFRTMTPAPADAGVTGGEKQSRITPAGRVLRRLRLDELPQVFNILRGDMSFVGPRPPLRRYVEMFPDLYDAVLVCRPGVTGLATLHFHRHEEYILSACRSAADTEETYCRRCIPRKARLDLIYRHRRTMCLDALILARTARKVFLRR